MTCSRSAGIDEISMPPLRATTSACSAGDSPSTSLTSGDDPQLCALAKSGMHESSRAQRTAKIRGELTRSRHARRIARSLPARASNSRSDSVDGGPVSPSCSSLKIISGYGVHSSSSVDVFAQQQSGDHIHKREREAFLK